MKKKCYKKDFEIHYYEVNKFLEASPVSIMNYLQELAISHSQSVGYGIKRLMDEQRAWVLTRLNVKIERYPIWGEKIKAKTWPSSFQRCFGIREFIVTDEAGKDIIFATSEWIFLDTEKRKPVRAHDEMGNIYGVKNKRALEDTFNEQYSLEKEDFTKEFSVRRSDIDTNEHVNNTKYMEWVLEALPMDLYNDYILKYIDIRYMKELLLDDDITCTTQVIPQEDGCAGIHIITSPEGFMEFAKAKTIWEKRN